MTTNTDEEKHCLAISIPIIPYKSALTYQDEFQKKIHLDNNPNTLLLLEHPSIYTIGRSGNDSDILVNQTFLNKNKIPVFFSNRGGQTTYHGPGQLICYPIFNIKKLSVTPRTYIQNLQKIITSTLEDFGIPAKWENKPIGVWVKDTKIASIGIRISNGISTHGFSLNINPNLKHFDHIISCGLSITKNTSILQLTGKIPDRKKIESRILYHFSNIFEMNITFKNRLNVF